MEIRYFLSHEKLVFEKQRVTAGELPMNHAIRVIALTFVVAAAFTGSTPSKANAVASNLPSLSVPGPIPECNPFIHNCPPIR
jgi:hypothetical protein